MATLDEDKVMELVGQAAGDLGGALTTTLVRLGDQLGLYRGLVEGGPQTPKELATRTGTTERYLREWLNAQAAAGYVTYSGDGHYSMTPEQAEILTNEDSPAC